MSGWPRAGTLLLGHRGAPRELPENTLAGFRLAVAQGADGVELDVHAAADGVPVVIHDPTLARTTAGSGEVRALPGAALERWIPSLDQVAAWAGEAGAWLNVEIKVAGAGAAALAVLEQREMLPRTLVSSFLPETVREVRRLAPEVPSFLLTEHWDRAARKRVRETGAGGVCLEERAATDAALAGLRELRLPVVVWTVDRPARLCSLFRAGVAGIITNVPARAAAERRRLAG